MLCARCNGDRIMTPSAFRLFPSDLHFLCTGQENEGWPVTQSRLPSRLHQTKWSNKLTLSPVSCSFCGIRSGDIIMRQRWTCSPPLSVNLSHFSVGVFSLWPGFLFGVAVCLCLKNILVVLKNFPISTWSALQFLGMWSVFFVSCCVKDSHQNADRTVLLLTNASRPLNGWHSFFFTAL